MPVPDPVLRKDREMEHDDELINAALDQILADVEDKDLTAIEELLTYVPREVLMGFLSKVERIEK